MSWLTPALPFVICLRFYEDYSLLIGAFGVRFLPILEEEVNSCGCMRLWQSRMVPVQGETGSC
jgi:hypothetical protein